MKPPGNEKVLVAMSGGVDSSVAACLLKEAGCDVVGVFMRLGAETHASGKPTPYDTFNDHSTRNVRLNVRPPDTPAAHKNRGCCSAADAYDARQVAKLLDIPFYVLNFEEDFNHLIDYFVDEYANARTPNPCIRCNQWLKFGKLIRYADLIGAQWIATGHYARCECQEQPPRLQRARWPDKDQSYVLFGIRQEILCRTRFPLGEMTKQEVRRHARRFGLSLSEKPESQDICFVPDGDYTHLLRSRRSDVFRSGTIRHVDGRRLGTHSGTANYTIGQRRGLGIALGSPVYVTALDAATDTVVVGPSDELLSETAHVREVHWLCEPECDSIRADVQIRYHHAAAAADVLRLSKDDVRVHFDTPQSAVTPGQAAVFYRGDQVLGGGWIEGR